MLITKDPLMLTRKVKALTAYKPLTYRSASQMTYLSTPTVIA